MNSAATTGEVADVPLSAEYTHYLKMSITPDVSGFAWINH